MSRESSIPDDLKKPLLYSLLALRLGVFIVMLMWTLDKFINPSHASKVFEAFYGIGWLNQHSSYFIGTVEMLLILAFVAGLWRRWTYGGVLLIHAISTFSSYKQYLAPFDNLLFLAACPMLAACLALYWLRNWDMLFTFPLKGSR
ncbi:hypothetical protein SAMN05216419_102319 [Nitrosomonas cryotolerans]|uniref:DoxX protein n=1 Tax=Nitrosomonas cryotolerans ATCC 49181 TaxID=1131553 RepID=A0A1N6I964_9PROT|nr:hypothetical protein [Nitrosomonas cryotolerans]SFP83323.1 hypothetical protein SAMN05216419_102319 [Nitrosomonas cryotolerans]SIO28505.1 hypothetical protein SAMN02743940_1642 [Nitrosomonas cryotolerans ATCC 49181]